MSRESLKDAVSSFGTPMYVDFSFGEREAWIRLVGADVVRYMLNAEEKDDGLLTFPPIKTSFTVQLSVRLSYTQ